jgi:peptidoglycan hydrolase CwlO-like protein
VEDYDNPVVQKLTNDKAQLQDTVTYLQGQIQQQQQTTAQQQQQIQQQQQTTAQQQQQIQQLRARLREANNMLRDDKLQSVQMTDEDEVDEHDDGHLPFTPGH